jgi:hypothetical protein
MSNPPIRDQLNDSRPPPFHSLPPELISDIFLRCICVGDDGPSMEIMTTPLTLARVCSAWRSVALATPRLWSKILYEFVPRHGQAESARLSLFLERSAPCLLSIHALQAIQSHNRSQPVPIVEDVIRALVAHSPRWESVRFRFRLWAFASLERQFFSLPNLRHADLHILESVLTDDAKDLIAFSTSPRLCSASLSSQRSVSVHLPFESLTECTMRVTDVRTCIELLSSARGLLKCTIENTDVWTDSPLPSLTSHIRSLEIIYARGLGPFLQALTLPALSRIVIRYIHNPYLARGIIDLGARSVWSECLRELVILRVSITEADVIDLLSGLPRLQSLVAGGPCVGTKLITILTHTSGLVPLLPELCSLELSLHGNHPVTKMVESRWNILVCDRELIQRIKYVRLHMRRSKRDAEYSMRFETLERLQREGLDLQFNHSWSRVSGSRFFEPPF